MGTKILGASVLIGIFTATSVVLADKVTLSNGDTLTGQIKKLDNGVLHLEYFKQTVQIPWQEVTA
ncbi:MAG: hypothetical protein EHM61_07615, partial [Acidobacteria bacterium]